MTKRSKLVKKLDKVFSIFIRTRYVDSSGYGNCITCGANRLWKEVDAGHFVGRSAMSVRWNEFNVQFQCKRCNMRSGEQYLYSKALDSRYGEGTSETLFVLGKQTQKFGVIELQSMIDYYTEKVDEIKHKKGLQ